MAFDGTLKFDTAIDKSGFESAISGLGSIAKKGMALVTGAVAAGSAAVSALGGYAISTGKSFESSMAQVIATMGITKDTIQDGVNSYELLKEAASAAGESTTFSASEAADALNYLALAGYDAQKAAEALPAVLDLAAAGGMDLAYASDLATDAMAALGIEATKDNLTRFGDEMAKTASKANTSVSQLGEAILTVGGTAKSLSGGTTELNAALGVLANRGIKGSEGGTALRNIILALSAPTDKAALALEGLGVKAFDADGNLRPLNETFRDLDKALAGMSEGEKTQVLNEIFNKVDLKSAQAMLAGCGEEFDNLTFELEGCKDAMHDMAETMNDTLEGDIKSLQSKAEAFGNAIYEDINAPLRKLVELGGEYVSELTAAFKEGGFEGLAEAFGGILGDVVTKAAEYLPKLVEMGAAVITSLADGLLANAGAISQSAVSIMSTLVSTFAQLTPKLLEAAMKAITSFAKGITDNLPKLSATVTKLIEDLAKTLTENLPALAEAVGEMLTGICELIAENIEPFLDAALTVIEAVAMTLIENVEPLVNALSEVIVRIAEYISENADTIAEMAVTLITVFAECIIENAPKILAALTILFASLIEYELTYLTTWISHIDDFLEDIIEDVSRFFEGFTDYLSEQLADMVDTGISKASEFLDGIKEKISQLPDKISEHLSEVIDAIKDWGSDLLRGGINAGKDLVDGLITTVSDIPRRMVSFGKDIVTGLWDGIKEKISWLWDKAKDFASGFLGTIKGAFGIASPSKVMRDQVGKYLAQGVGVGFDDELPDVKNSINRMISGITIDSSAYSALSAGIPQLYSGIAPGASEVISNSYSTVYNNNTAPAPKDEAPVIVHTHVYLDGAEIAEHVDERQGESIVLKERGVSV